MKDDTYSPGARRRLATLGYIITDDESGCHIALDGKRVETLESGAWLEQVEERLAKAARLPRQWEMELF